VADVSKMTRVQRLGYDRGASDKLAGRPYDNESPPEARGGVREYKKFYRRGYNETDVPGAMAGAFGDELPVTLPTSISTPIIKMLAPTAAPAPRPTVTLSPRAQEAAKAAESLPVAQSSTVADTPPPSSAAAATVFVPPKGPGEIIADWFGQNWKYVAAGVAMVAVGAVVYKATAKNEEPVARPALPPPPPMR